MNFKVCAVCVVIQFYFVGNVAVKLRNFHTENITVEAGSNVTALCDGNGPLSWQLPEKKWYFSDEDHGYWKGTTIRITEVSPKDENYKYGSEIVLQNVTYPHTGFIICFEIKRPFRQDKIYMYFRDEEHPSVSTERTIVIYANIGISVLVPFKTTSPDVSINIHLDYYKIHSFIKDYYGFWVRVKAIGTFEFEFNCQWLKNHYYLFYSYLVRFEQPLTINLTKISNKVTYVGEELRLFCEAKYRNKIQIEWTTPAGLHDTGSELLIKNVSAKDQGIYICRIREDFGKNYLLGTRNIYEMLSI